MHRSRWTLSHLPIAAGILFLGSPVLGLLLRTPWPTLVEELQAPPVRSALRLSLLCSFGASLASVVLGLPLAVWLASGRSLPRTSVRVLVVLPMVLPPVVGGVGLLLAFGRAGFLGQWLDRLFGITLPFTTAGAILAGTYVALPFFVLTVEAGLRALDPRFQGAAATLGAAPRRRFLTITLPLVAPALGAGLVLAWARALGEFGATITFAGNLEGSTRTLPLAVFVALESHPETAFALSLVLVLVSIVVLVSLRHRWFPKR